MTKEGERINRREFLRRLALGSAGVGAVVVANEVRKLFERGVTLDHAVKALRRVVRNPDVVKSFWMVEEGIKRGEVLPDLDSIESQSDVRPGYVVVKSSVSKWSVKSSGESVENQPIAVSSVIIPKSVASVRISSKPESELAIPFSAAMAAGGLRVTEDPNAYGYKDSLGGVKIENNTIDVVAGDQVEIGAQVGEDLSVFYQAPFGFSAQKEVPGNVAGDTYLWCMMAETDSEIILQTIDVGTRISVKNQLELMKRISLRQGFAEPEEVLLLAKGSGNGLVAGDEVFGSPLEMVREGQTRYLNIDPS